MQPTTVLLDTNLDVIIISFCLASGFMALFPDFTFPPAFNMPKEWYPSEVPNQTIIQSWIWQSNH